MQCDLYFHGGSSGGYVPAPAEEPVENPEVVADDAGRASVKKRNAGNSREPDG